MERVVLVGVHLDLKDTIMDTNEASIKELHELCAAAGLASVGVFIQNRHKLETGTYIGEGKIAEVAEFIRANDIDKAVFDDELSGIQVRNLADRLGVGIIDRSTLILDIFAQRARSKEGQLQVELAQLRHLLPRLAGSSVVSGLSRAGVGVGARGPGETKLETDKRAIHRKISAIKEDLKDIEKQRETQRKDRKKSGVQSVALLGYTNAGKSTIMNALTGAEVFAEDMLFATLDPTARKREMPSGAEVVFVDTVGFVRKLPHHLIRAFSSTLEESMICDVLLHVVDYSSEEREIEEEIVERLLEKLNKAGKPVIKVYNKIDKVEGEPVGATVLGRPRAMGTIAPTNGGEVFISAKEGQGLDILLEAIENALPEKRLIVEICVPYDKGAAVAKLHEVAAVQEEEYEAGGTRMLVSISQKDYDKVREMINLKE